ncbi:MAG: nucleoside deaminase [Ruminococcaceae bacterium]|nr:nucleoside deaminase [Oscillospiraceae bacterium]
MDDIKYMMLALEEAKNAFDENEVPVGAVLVDENGRVIAKAHNRRECDKNAILHAELMTINEGCKALGGWRLHKCTLYVTLEPCPMCAGAIVNSRIKRVVYGAKDPKAGCFGSVLNLNSYPFNHKPEIISGVCEKQSLELMEKFFNRLREKRNEKNN